MLTEDNCLRCLQLSGTTGEGKGKCEQDEVTNLVKMEEEVTLQTRMKTKMKDMMRLLDELSPRTKECVGDDSDKTDATSPCTSSAKHTANGRYGPVRPCGAASRVSV